MQTVDKGSWASFVYLLAMAAYCGTLLLHSVFGRFYIMRTRLEIKTNLSSRGNFLAKKMYPGEFSAHF